MSKNTLSKRPSMIWPALLRAALAPAALVAFSFPSMALAAGGQSGSSQTGSGGSHSGASGSGFSGGGFTGGGFSGGRFSSGAFSGGHSAFSGGGRSTFGSGGRSSFGSAVTPFGGTHFSPSVGSGSGSSVMTHSYSHSGNSGSQSGLNHWNSGQYYRNHWNWFGYPAGYIYPYYFTFVPYLYGSFGYGYPYYDYGGPYAYYALYDNGDDGQQPLNLPQAVDPGPPLAAFANGQAPIAGPPNAGPNAVAQNGGAAAVADANDADEQAGAEFFAQAEAAFQEGRYHDALKLANHAAVESPRNPKAHELMSLSMFALADYRGAAIEAHAAIALGPIADWATVFGYYGDQAKYTAQLRALEKYSHENPKAADARFLRGYQYLMIGHVDSAKEQLAEAVKLTPNDKLAADLLKKYSGNAEAAPPAAGAPNAPQNPPAKPANADADSFDT